MMLTIDVSDDLALRATAAGLAFADLSRFAATGAHAEIAAAAIEAVSPAPTRRSIMDFAGVGAGRPGAIGDDVQGYIDAMRDEGDECNSEANDGS